MIWRMASLIYQLTEDQFIAGQRLHSSLRPWWSKWLLRLITLAGLLLLAVGLYYGNYWLILAGLLYAVISLFNFSLITQPLLRRTYRRSPSLHQQSQVELREGQLHLSSMNGGGVLPWAHIIQWAEDERSLLLYLQPRLFIIVPKDEAAGSEFAAALREQLQAHAIKQRR